MTTADPAWRNVADQLASSQLPDVAELTSLANAMFRTGFHNGPGPVPAESAGWRAEGPPLGAGTVPDVAPRVVHIGHADFPLAPGQPGVPQGLVLSLVDPPMPSAFVFDTALPPVGLPSTSQDSQVAPIWSGFPDAHPDIHAHTEALGSPARSGAASLSIAEFHPKVLARSTNGAAPTQRLDPQAIRRDFPILAEWVNGRPLIWLDNAATTQKPQQVIDRISHFYAHENSNIHRAAHTLAARSTDAYEGAREKLRRFLNASSEAEIVFVRGATEGINLVADAWGQAHIGAGDEILITHLEHHANIVPWQQLAQRTGAVLKVAPVDDTGQVIVSEFERRITPRTRIAAMTQVSNALGTITPVAELVQIAHRHGVVTLVDAAQSVPHMTVDVTALDADFLVFSGHKMFAPTGIGVVYAKSSIWADTPPWQGGGNMIAEVTFERTTYQDPPTRFEAGTGNIADAVGLGTAVDYLTAIGLENITAYERGLLEYGTAGLQSIPGLRLIGTAANKAGVLSFVLAGHDPVQVGMLLDREGIAVRAGHHCAQPILRRFGVSATVRPSLAMYNTKDELDCLVEAVARIQAGAVRV